MSVSQHFCALIPKSKCLGCWPFGQKRARPGGRLKILGCKNVPLHGKGHDVGVADCNQLYLELEKLQKGTVEVAAQEKSSSAGRFCMKGFSFSKAKLHFVMDVYLQGFISEMNVCAM